MSSAHRPTRTVDWDKDSRTSPKQLGLEERGSRSLGGCPGSWRVRDLNLRLEDIEILKSVFSQMGAGQSSLLQGREIGQFFKRSQVPLWVVQGRGFDPQE